MNLLLHSVVICIAGSVYMNGYNNLEKHLYVLFVKVAYHKINLFLYLPKKIRMILEGQGPIQIRLGPTKVQEIYLIGQVVKEVNHNLTKILTMVLAHLEETIITFLEIPTVAL